MLEVGQLQAEIIVCGYGLCYDRSNLLLVCFCYINQFVGKNLYQTICFVASSKYKFQSHTTTAPPLSAGLISMSVQLRKNISASLCSFERFCTVACLLKSRQLISVWQRWMKWSQEENWLDGGIHLDCFGFCCSKILLSSRVLVGSLCSRLSLVAPGSSTGPSFSSFWFWKKCFQL